jgi:Yip1-like protein
MSTAPTAISDQQPLLSQPARIVNIFIDPVKTFTDLNRGTAWWMAFILISAFSLALIGTVDKKIGFDQVVDNNFKLAPKQAERFEQLPPDQKAKALATQVKATRYGSYAYPVIALVFLLIIAGVLTATYNFGAGASVSFGKSLAIVIYASLPGILRATLAIISIFAGKDPETFYFQNPAATNLGYFIDPVQHRFLYSLGSAVDIFAIWTMALTAIGFSCVSKVKRGTSFAIVFGWYILFVLVGAGIAAAFS